MKSTIQPVETPEDAPAKKLVKLSVIVDEDEFDRDIDKAFRRNSADCGSAFAPSTRLLILYSTCSPR